MKSDIFGFKGEYIGNSLGKNTKKKLYEHYLEGNASMNNPYFWPMYTVSYLNTDSHRMEQQRNDILAGEYVGPGKTIQGSLLKDTYIDTENGIDPVRRGLVLKIEKDGESNIIAIICLDTDTREVIQIDPNKKIVLC